MAALALSVAALVSDLDVFAQDGSVKYDKTVTKKPDENGVYTISLEAYVTGSVTVTETTKPADIVLVLDYSQSMENNMAGSATNVNNVAAQDKRINILRDAVAKFVNTVKESNTAMLADGGGDTYGGHRLSFVIFHQSVTATSFLNVQNLTATPASGSGNNYTRATVYNGTNNIIGANTQIYTRSGDAMERAESVLNDVDYTVAPNRTRVVVFFTDGAPGDSNNETNWQNNSGQRNEANQCITAANSIKSSSKYGATIYSVGLFNKAAGTADATTTYLRYVSSDTANAPSIGTSAPTGGWLPVSGNKSIVVSSAGALANVFSSIATSAGGDYSASSASSVLIDVVASSFTIPTDADLGQIKVYKVACTQESASAIISWSTTRTDITNSIGLDTSVENEVSVTGFDYGAEWCGWDGENSQPHGHKLVLEIPIMIAEGAIGGPAVETNTSDSKLIIKDKDGKVISENQFPRPTLEIPISIWIKKKGLDPNDSAVFNIGYAPYEAGADPSKLTYKHFTKIMITKDTPRDEDGFPVEKLVGLDPHYFYRIKEDAWAWSYDYQDGGIQYTVGEGGMNPFVFENIPKETPKEAEATVRNTFEKRTTEIVTTPTTE